MNKLFPLDALWKWLYTSFAPLDNNTSGGIPRDILVKEFLALSEVNKAQDKIANAFARPMMGRLLVVLYKTSPLSANGFLDSKKSVLCLKRLTKAESEKRNDTIPVFSEELRSQLLKEVREEFMGRKSAQSLLSLASSPSNSSTQLSITSTSSNATSSSTSSNSHSPIAPHPAAKVPSSPTLSRSVSLPVGANFTLFNPIPVPPSPVITPGIRRSFTVVQPQPASPNKRQKRAGEDDIHVVDNSHPSLQKTVSMPHGNVVTSLDQILQRQILMQNELEQLRRFDKLVSAELQSLKAEINVLRRQLDVNRGNFRLVVPY